MNDVLQLIQLRKRFVQGQKTLDILKNADLTLKENEVVGLVGPSGSGKSTLLHITGLLEKPDEGNVIIAGKNCFELSDLERTKIRLNEIGFVYQYHHLLPEFSAFENVSIPQMMRGGEENKIYKRTKELLDIVGLSERYEHRPAELSGGEQQRVAIARALANHPSLLLADEPTGNLDPETADRVFNILYDAVKANKGAALIVTHNKEIAEKCDSYVLLQQGKLVEQ